MHKRNHDNDEVMEDIPLKKQKQEEPLLNETKNRYVLFPLDPLYQDAWKMYKKLESVSWPAQEIDLSKDRQVFESLSSDEQRFIEHVLAFFAASDGIISANLASRFLNEVQIPEVKYFYAFQIANENVHAETYSLLIDTLIQDQKKKESLFHAIDTMPAIREKADWALRYLVSPESLATRVVAFAAVEGIFFSGSFCCIFWLRKRGIPMNGLIFANDLISRDEGLHTDFACLLYNKMIKHRLSDQEVHKIIEDCVNVETQFVCDAIPVALIGLNRSLMSQYIQFVADRLLTALQHPKLYNVANPFEWMELISLTGKTNFFEKHNSDYHKITTSADLTEHCFSSDDF